MCLCVTKNLYSNDESGQFMLIIIWAVIAAFLNIIIDLQSYCSEKKLKENDDLKRIAAQYEFIPIRSASMFYKINDDMLANKRPFLHSPPIFSHFSKSAA